VPGRDDASGSQLELRLDLVFNVGLGNRVEDIGSKNFGITADDDPAASAKNVQMTDAGVVLDDELFSIPKEIEMTYSSAITDATTLYHERGEAQAYAVTDSVSTETTIDGRLETPRQKGEYAVKDETQHDLRN
jgi:hypothetical protein